jgi:hypothetical protein
MKPNRRVAKTPELLGSLGRAPPWAQAHMSRTRRPLRDFDLTTFSLRGRMTAPQLASTSNFALILIAPQPHIPQGLTPLRTMNRTTNATRSAEVPNLDSVIAPRFPTDYRVSWQRRRPL